MSSRHRSGYTLQQFTNSLRTSFFACIKQDNQVTIAQRAISSSVIIDELQRRSANSTEESSSGRL